MGFSTNVGVSILSHGQMTWMILDDSGFFGIITCILGNLHFWWFQLGSRCSSEHDIKNLVPFSINCPTFASVHEHSSKSRKLRSPGQSNSFGSLHNEEGYRTIDGRTESGYIWIQ